MHQPPATIEGEWLGDYESFLLQTPSNCLIEALEDCELFTLSYPDMQALYQHSQRFERFGRIMAEQLFLATAKSKSDLLRHYLLSKAVLV